MRLGWPALVCLAISGCKFQRPDLAFQDAGHDDDGATHDGATGDGTGADAAIDAAPDASVDAAATVDAPPADAPLAHFSFFVTSLRAMRMYSGSQNGFGGDLRFGETGAGAGLRGADKLCATIAGASMAGAEDKGWRAFLSASDDGNGNVVNAIDRIGAGPWYDRTGRQVASSKANLMAPRPVDADATIKNDLPNEDGVPNHDPDGTGQVDNEDVLTGTNTSGAYYGTGSTCQDWTTAVGGAATGHPRVGHPWIRNSGNPNADPWMSMINESGCAPGVELVEMGPPSQSAVDVGSGGGYGAIYCFALMP